MISVINREIFTLEYWSKRLVIPLNNLVILESLLVGYHDIHFRINYRLYIIINYEPVYSSSE